MELKKLNAFTLVEALKNMSVGETCLAPDGYTIPRVKRSCVYLNAKGYTFQTSSRTGQFTITRLA